MNIDRSLLSLIWLIVVAVAALLTVGTLAVRGEPHWAWFAAGLLLAWPIGVIAARRRRQSRADERERLARFARVIAADNLASRFNHTISSPLQAAMLLADQGRRTDADEADSASLREDIGIIHDALEETATLLRQLREPTRLGSAGTLRTAPEAELLAAVERAIEDGLPRRRLTVQIDRPMPDLALEPDTLGVILHGLFDEARHACREGSRERSRITLRAGREASSEFTIGLRAPWDRPPAAWADRWTDGSHDNSALAIARLLVERVGGRTGTRQGSAGTELWLSLPTT